MEQAIAAVFLALFGGESGDTSAPQTPPAVVQSVSGNSHAGGGGRNSVPMNSPEPITMIALAGGAAFAGGLSSRKKKKTAEE